ncbi:hypothetical protein K431DRAFT_288605 [Polychaeton citri CBS 116435]|uniref:NADH dehydrogenase [ubiquinone] 1 beta subcomplex subunit 9 n=1 Tax=Polychaeton citri CBS 116435 TaxID=1314669 RepID=A0A9P4UKF3_9PEZI|nr:hypothetical protein K431DRAFT_288605 [Polychaeton citri CBS 116435]
MAASHAYALSLYRRSLKLALDWTIERKMWRGQALYIRSLFEANKHITQPRQQKAIFEETEAVLEKWKHPDPYRHPTAPGGSKYERNLPCPNLDRPPKDGAIEVAQARIYHWRSTRHVHM